MHLLANCRPWIEGNLCYVVDVDYVQILSPGDWQLYSLQDEDVTNDDGGGGGGWRITDGGFLRAHVLQVSTNCRGCKPHDYL